MFILQHSKKQIQQVQHTEKVVCTLVWSIDTTSRKQTEK